MVAHPWAAFGARRAARRVLDDSEARDHLHLRKSHSPSLSTGTPGVWENARFWLLQGSGHLGITERGIKWWLENSFALKYNSLLEAKRIITSERGVTQKGGGNKSRGVCVCAEMSSSKSLTWEAKLNWTQRSLDMIWRIWTPIVRFKAQNANRYTVGQLPGGVCGDV